MADPIFTIEGYVDSQGKLINVATANDDFSKLLRAYISKEFGDNSDTPSESAYEQAKWVFIHEGTSKQRKQIDDQLDMGDIKRFLANNKGLGDMALAYFLDENTRLQGITSHVQQRKWNKKDISEKEKAADERIYSQASTQEHHTQEHIDELRTKLNLYIALQRTMENGSGSCACNLDRIIMMYRTETQRVEDYYPNNIFYKIEKPVSKSTKKH